MVILISFLVFFALLCIGGMLIINNSVGKSGKQLFRMNTAKKIEPFAFLMPTVILLLIMFGFPLIRTLIMAFQNYKLTQPNKIYFNSFANFKNLFSDSDIGLIIKNSFIYVICSVIGQFLLGMGLAFALKKPFKGRGLYQSIVFLPWAFSAFVIGLMYRWSFNGEYGVINDLLLRLGAISEKTAWLGTPGLSLIVVMLAMIWMGVPFFAIMILAALQSIPHDIYEASYLDVCSPARRFFQIILPYIKPTIIVTLLLRTIWIFNSFDMIVIITNGGPANYSQTLPSYMYTKAFAAYDFGLASALGVILMGILAVYVTVFLTATKYNSAGDF